MSSPEWLVQSGKAPRAANLEVVPRIDLGSTTIFVNGVRLCEVPDEEMFMWLGPEPLVLVDWYERKLVYTPRLTDSVSLDLPIAPYPFTVQVPKGTIFTKFTGDVTTGPTEMTNKKIRPRKELISPKPKQEPFAPVNRGPVILVFEDYDEDT